MRILAIDPGPEQSGYVVLDGARVVECGVLPNSRLVSWVLSTCIVNHCAIEMIASYGMAVGKDVFETCVWIGRFAQQWADASGAEPLRIPRKEIALHLCSSPRAKDTNVRQALIDRLGPPGTKRNPGPTYGVTGHAWAALAVAVTAADRLAAGASA